MTDKKVTIEELLRIVKMSGKDSKMPGGSDIARAGMFTRVPSGLGETFNGNHAENKHKEKNDHDDVDGAIFSRIKPKLADTTQDSVSEDNYFDEADHALFTRIESIPCFDTGSELPVNESDIIPISYNSICAEAPATFYGNSDDLQRTESFDDIDTGDRNFVDLKRDSDRITEQTNEPVTHSNTSDSSDLDNELCRCDSKHTSRTGNRLSNDSDTRESSDIHNPLISSDNDGKDDEDVDSQVHIDTAMGLRTSIPIKISEPQLNISETNELIISRTGSRKNVPVDESEQLFGKLQFKRSLGVRKSMPNDEQVPLNNATNNAESHRESRSKFYKTPEGLSEPEMEQLKCEEPSGDGVSRFTPKILFSLILPFVSLLLFLADIGTDIRLAVSYRREGDIGLFYITLACIIAPSIIMAAVDLSWLWLDREKSKESNSYIIFRVVLGVLSFGRVVRAVQYMYHIVKKNTGPHKSWHRNAAIAHKRDCYMMDFINAFIESCPQLFVQMYLLYKYNLPMEFLRVINLLTSWISIAWTYASYYRSHREALFGRQDVKLLGIIPLFLSILSFIAVRVICVVLFLVYFKPWIGVPVLVAHFIAMLVWIIYQNPSLEGTTNTMFGRFMYYLFFAYVSMVCFVNLKDSRARIRMSMFYLLIYLENCVISGLVIWRMLLDDRTSEKTLNFIALPVGFVWHVAFLLLYYRCFHPKIGMCYKPK